MKRYISKGNWFDKGTEAELIADCVVHGLFRGIKDGKEDEELCPFEEFEIINE